MILILPKVRHCQLHGKEDKLAQTTFHRVQKEGRWWRHIFIYRKSSCLTHIITISSCRHWVDHLMLPVFRSRTFGLILPSKGSATTSWWGSRSNPIVDCPSQGEDRGRASLGRPLRLLPAEDGAAEEDVASLCSTCSRPRTSLPKRSKPLSTGSQLAQRWEQNANALPHSASRCRRTSNDSLWG